MGHKIYEENEEQHINESEPKEKSADKRKSLMLIDEANTSNRSNTITYYEN